MPEAKGEADLSAFPLGRSHVQSTQSSYSIYDWFRELYDSQQRLEQRVKALEDENTALKVRVAELEEWRDGLEPADQIEGLSTLNPGGPILPLYEK